jgi:hypothetical protein
MGHIKWWNQNYIQVWMESGMIYGTVYYHSVQNILFTHLLLFENAKTRIQGTATATASALSP